MQNQANNQPRKYEIILDLFTFLKIGLVLGAIAVLITNVHISFLVQKADVDCIEDKLMNASSNVNDYLINNDKVRNALTIISSLFIDISFLGTAIFWILYDRSWRIIFVLILFYGVRAIIQSIFILRFPDGFAFLKPGFPSLIVGYTRSSDFFYSGHIGLPLICALEFSKNDLLAPSIICVFISLFQGIFMLFVRAHYTIDLISGLVFAHYFFLVVDKYIHYVDDKWLELTNGVCLVGKDKNSDKEVEIPQEVTNKDFSNYEDQKKLLSNEGE